jgi:hypothetical protein
MLTRFPQHALLTLQVTQPVRPARVVVIDRHKQQLGTIRVRPAELDSAVRDKLYLLIGAKGSL